MKVFVKVSKIQFNYNKDLRLLGLHKSTNITNTQGAAEMVF